MNYSNKKQDKKISKKNIEYMASSSSGSISIVSIIFIVFIYISVSVIYYQAYLRTNDFGPMYAVSWPFYLFFIGLKDSLIWLSDAFNKIGNDKILSQSTTLQLP
jgi:hypothetical protein